MVSERKAYDIANSYASKSKKDKHVSSMGDVGTAYFFTLDWPDGTTCSEDGILVQKATGEVSEMAALTAMIEFENNTIVDIASFQTENAS